MSLDKNEIRKAYLKKARQLHPDRLQIQRLSIAAKDDNETEGEIITTTKVAAAAAAIETTSTADTTFDELHQAYIHLTEEDGIGDQVNPAHSLNRMLRYVNSVGSSNVNANKNDNDNDNNDEKKDNDNDANDGDSDSDDSSFFKARLIAVLLEYGDKGIDLSNVKKKWKQVWPKIPFPSQQQQQDDDGNDNDDNDEKNKVITIIPLVDFLLQKAGDVIRIERIGNKNRRVIVHAKHHFGLNSKENILREGSITKSKAAGVVEEKV
jgi:hypothetical protein